MWLLNIMPASGVDTRGEWLVELILDPCLIHLIRTTAIHQHQHLEHCCEVTWIGFCELVLCLSI